MVEKDDSPSNIDVVRAYIDYHRMALDKEGVLRRLTETPWAIDFVSDLVYEDPVRCWRLLYDIAKMRPANDAMVSLGVTLGSLLREQPDVMDMIETEASTDQRLTELMLYIMENENIRPGIWVRIEAISSKP